MNVREKLVELLGAATFGVNKQTIPSYLPNTAILDVADHLIANGVTVQELDGCQHCVGVSYTDNPFTVITQMGREVKTQFNFCPNCGRRLPQPPKGE